MNKQPSATAMSNTGEFDVAQWPFYWLTRFTGRYLNEVEIALKTIGLDVPRWRVLMTLRGPRMLSVSEIADHAIVKLPTMTKILQRMQVDDLVTCSQSAADRRVTEVSLTAKGTESGQHAWEAVNAIYRKAFDGVSDADTARLNRILNRITNNLDG